MVACSIALGRHSYFGGSPFCFGWRPFSIALRRRTTCSCGDSGPGCRARGGRPENWSALSLVLLPLRCPGHRRADPNPLPASRRRSLAARSNYVVGHGSRIGLLAEDQELRAVPQSATPITRAARDGASSTGRALRLRSRGGSIPPVAQLAAILLRAASHRTRIRSHLVGLRMPRALETLDHVMQQLERGQLGAIEAVEALLAEEITVRESRRVKAALQMARLATIKTLSRLSTSRSSRRSTVTGSLRSPSSTSSIAMKSCISLVSPVPAKVIWRQLSASRLSAPAAVSTSRRSPTSSTHSLKLTAKDVCANAFASSAVPRCSSLMRSAISPSG